MPKDLMQLLTTTLTLSDNTLAGCKKNYHENLSVNAGHPLISLHYPK
jgi:hypothetical protein